jgi:hypothetical protein
MSDNPAFALFVAAHLSHLPPACKSEVGLIVDGHWGEVRHLEEWACCLQSKMAYALDRFDLNTTERALITAFAKYSLAARLGAPCDPADERPTIGGADPRGVAFYLPVSNASAHRRQTYLIAGKRYPSGTLGPL